jgi:hypothetical protein
LELEYSLAWICGDVCIWKPSEKTPLCGIACQNIINEVLKENNLPQGISNLVIGDAEIGDLMAKDTRFLLFLQLVLPEWENCSSKCSSKIRKISSRIRR